MARSSFPEIDSTHPFLEQNYAKASFITGLPLMPNHSDETPVLHLFPNNDGVTIESLNSKLLVLGRLFTA